MKCLGVQIVKLLDRSQKGVQNYHNIVCQNCTHFIFDFQILKGLREAPKLSGAIILILWKLDEIKH